MTFKLLTEPELEEAIEFINKHKRTHVLVIYANCKVDYNSRAKSKLNCGNRLGKNSIPNSSSTLSEFL